MSCHPLDAVLVAESYAQIRREKCRLEGMIAAKHNLQRFGFARELHSRLDVGEIVEDVEIMQWQSCNAALLDWLDLLESVEPEPDPIKLEPASSSEGPQEAALFFAQ